MNSKKIRLIVIFISGLFLLIDQFLKWQAFYHWNAPRLFSPRLGWQLFLNTGAAFGLPLPHILAMVLSLPIIGLTFYMFLKEWHKQEIFSFPLFLSWSLILAGAISNLLDRIIYRRIIDYFLIGTALLNIGDIMIVAGLIIFLLLNIKKNKSS